MSSVCVAVNNFKFSATDKILFDTNIWLLMYGPDFRPNDHRVDLYSGAFKRLLSANGKPRIDKLVLCEYVNRHAKTEYGYWKGSAGNNLSFKDYRNSANFAPVAKAIRTIVRKIMKQSIAVNSTFPPADLDELLDTLVTEQTDFNDLLLAETCRECDLKIMTDDADFAMLGVDILTANPAMLQ